MRSANFWDFTQRRMVVFADVSGQHVCPIFECQVVQEEFLTFEDGTDKLSRNVDTELPFYAV